VNQLKDITTNTEQQITTKRERAMVPDEPSRGGEADSMISCLLHRAATATHALDAKLPVVALSRGTQEPFLQKTDGNEVR
jgi:hypothetical protein